MATPRFGGAAAAALTVGGLALLVSSAGAQVPLVFSPAVAENLELMYHRFAPDEFAVCLLGESDGTTYHISDYAMPPQERVSILVGQMAQTGLKVKDGICGERYGSRVTLHSHAGTDRDDYCYASRSDTVTTVLHTKDEYLAIVCRRGILWFHRSQLVAGEPAYPIPGQIWPLPGRWSP